MSGTLADLLNEAVTEAVTEAPPTTVTAAATYRRGKRRRRIVQACTAGGAAVVLGVGGYGIAQLAPDGGGSLPTGAVAPRVRLDPLPNPPTRCPDLAEAFKNVAAATLPADIEWTGTRVPEGADLECDSGGLVWATFTADGRADTIGFEGGVMQGEPCDTGRKVTRCDVDGPYTVGHYESADDYGVLLGTSRLFYFVGLEDGRGPALSTDQLAAVAKEVARVIYGS